jgi:hypothetical protein
MARHLDEQAATFPTHARGVRVPFGQFGDDTADRSPIADLAGAGSVCVQERAGGLLGPPPRPPGPRYVRAQPRLALSGRELSGPQVFPGLQR